MKKIILILFLTVFLIAILFATEEEKKKEDVMAFKVTVLYDNYVYTEGTKADLGFACLIEGAEKTILLDTGTKPDILRYNIKTLDVDLSELDQIVLSHIHGDHTGGLWSVLDKHPDVEAKEIIQEFGEAGVIKCGATHCTGDQAIAVFKEFYGDDYVIMGAGKVITMVK